MNQYTAGYNAVTDHIVMLLKREPLWSADELAQASGFSITSVRTRLKNLKALGRVYVVDIGGVGGSRQYWQYGPKPRNLNAVNADARLKYEASLPEQRVQNSTSRMTQRIVTTWKPNHVRMEFETYFHGPARREAA